MSEKQAPFAERSSFWMRGGGPSADVIVSTRVRLARNHKNVPFPPEMAKEHAEQVLSLARDLNDCLRRDSEGEYVFDFWPLSELDETDRWVLVEKHLVSPQLVKTAALSGVILRSDDAVSIMINEEDHFRIQCLFPGLNLTHSRELAQQVDHILHEVVNCAFDEQLGYLTTCPTNLGTGMRSSVMAHLPGLVMLNRLEDVISGLSEIGATVRGLYGEGTESRGDLFQISNRITLGQSESEICANLQAVIGEIVRKERSAREEAYGRRRDELEDKVFRAYGILTNARMIETKEAMRLLSALKLGRDLNIVTHVSQDLFSQMMIRMRPALIQSRAGTSLDPRQRDIRRASLIRNALLDS